MLKIKMLVRICAVMALLILGCAISSAETNQPGFGFATLLNGIQLDHATGELWLNNFQPTFLPPNLDYGYNSTGSKLYAILNDSTDTQVARIDLWAEQLESPYWLVSSYTVVADGNREDMGRVKLDSGDYSMDFFLDGDLFYKFPFSVDTVDSGDPFSGGTYYFLDGDWSNWGYLLYAEKNPEESLMWKVWLRNKAVEDEKDVHVDIQLTRDSNGAVVCVNHPETEWTLTPEWVRCDFEMALPAGQDEYGAYFKAKDLLADDGSYTISMNIDDEPYGIWHFNVENGELNYSGRTVRYIADAMTFIEGGRDAWWYEKE
jgi:hypothetical protein